MNLKDLLTIVRLMNQRYLREVRRFQDDARSPGVHCRRNIQKDYIVCRVER
jgi:hypothetical protein